MNSIETVPVMWDEQTERFFSLTADLFSPAFCYGAGVLLASYDLDDGSDPMKQIQMVKRTRSQEAPAVDLRTPSGRKLPF